MARIEGCDDGWGVEGETWLFDERPEVHVIFGPAGGWYLSLQVSVQGLTTDSVRLTDGIATVAGDTAVPFRTVGDWSLLADAAGADGTLWLDSIRMYETWSIADASKAPCSLEGQQLLLAVDLEEIETGRTARATREVEGELDPVDAASCASAP